MAKKYPAEVREKVLAFIADGGNKGKASKTFGVSQATIYKWLSKEPKKEPTMKKREKSSHQKVVSKRNTQTKKRKRIEVKDQAPMLAQVSVISQSHAPQPPTTLKGLWQSLLTHMENLIKTLRKK